MRNRMRSALVAAVLVVSAAGCGLTGGGTNANELTGKITVGGKPANGGFIVLYPANGPATSAYRGPVQPNGTFSVAAVPDGEYNVAFENNPAAAMGGYKPPPGVDVAKMPNLPTGAGGAAGNFPDKYKDPKASGKTWSVAKGSKSKNFDLTE
jgi:hypothetical protein